MKSANNMLTNRLDWVDGLKGVSAIIVVLQHTLVTMMARG